LRVWREMWEDGSAVCWDEEEGKLNRERIPFYVLLLYFCWYGGAQLILWENSGLWD